MVAGKRNESGGYGHWPVDPAVSPYDLRGLHAGAYTTDDQARVLTANPQAEALLRRPAAEMLGQDAHELLHRRGDGGRVARSECRLFKAFLSGRPAYGDDDWFATGNGSLLPVEWFICPCTLGNGRVGSTVLFTERNTEKPSPAAGIPAYTAELEELTDQLSLLAETTTVLTSTLDLREALRRLVQLVVPRLADWAIVDLFGEDDDLVGSSRQLRRVAVAHGKGGEHVRRAEFEGPLPPVTETARSPLSRALRGGLPMVVGPEDFDPPTSALAAVQRDLFSAVGIHSGVIAPLRGVRGVLGALTLARSEQKRPYEVADLALVDDLARRAGLAVDNAHLYERQRRVSETMQRHLLPPLPDVGLEMAVRYAPAPSGSQVGGDWYDAFRLADGTPALVIGDVVGHDLQAAANMSQVRNMLRAIAWEYEEPPSAVITRLDRALMHISEVSMATLILARLEGGNGEPWRLRWSNAGHPPPLLIDGDGNAVFLDNGQGILLGADAAGGREDAEVPLPPRTTVVMYTDGLIESPGIPLDSGLAELRRNAAELVSRPIGQFCDELLRRSRPPRNEDDVALLAVRVPAAG